MKEIRHFANAKKIRFFSFFFLLREQIRHLPVSFLISLCIEGSSSYSYIAISLLLAARRLLQLSLSRARRARKKTSVESESSEAGSRFPVVEVSAPRVEVTVRIDMAKLHLPHLHPPPQASNLPGQVSMAPCIQQIHPWLFIWLAASAMTSSQTKTGASTVDMPAATAATPRWKTSSGRSGSSAPTTRTAAAQPQLRRLPRRRRASAWRVPRSRAVPSSARRRCSASTSGTRIPSPST